VRQISGARDEYVLHQDVLYVASRAPRPGFAKTRLGREIGHDRAAALYAACLRDLAARLSRAPFRVGWYFTPDNGWSELDSLVTAVRGPWSMCGPILSQPPGDWTYRQQALFSTARSRNERRTILIASDSPQLDLDTIVEAFDRLRRDDLVLGPTDDGGYYLVGMRIPVDSVAVRPWEALAGVQMSTGTVLDEILSRAAGLGLRTSLLSPTFDVDEVADLSRLIPLALRRDDLAATRAVLETLGLTPTRELANEESWVPVAVGSVR
jgi:rSAM/selenodomain-associated transferase 1